MLKFSYLFNFTIQNEFMSDKTFVFIIVAIVIAHFLFAVGYLIWKIARAPKSQDSEEESDDQENFNQ